MIDESLFLQLSATVIRWDKVLFIMPSEKDGQVCVVFEGNVRLYFDGGEAREVWRIFSPKDSWRNET